MMPQMMPGPKGIIMRPRAPMFARPEPEEITIEDDNDAPIVVPQQRIVPRRPPMAIRGVGGASRGGRRGRPRLDPDTDLGKMMLLNFHTFFFESFSAKVLSVLH